MTIQALKMLATNLDNVSELFVPKLTLFCQGEFFSVIHRQLYNCCPKYFNIL